MKIAVAVAHTYRGAGCGANGYLNESDVSREVAPLVANKLNSQGHIAREFRIDKPNSYEYEDCYVRARQANEWGADLYVEMHLNSSSNKEANGTEVYIHPRDVDIIPYAKNINKCLCRDLDTFDRTYRVGYKKEAFIVLANTTMPAVLIEAFFCSNQEESNKYNPELLANAIVEGITGQPMQPLKPKASLSTLNVYDTLKEGEKIRLHAIANSGETEFSFHVRDPKGQWMCIRDYEDGSIYPYTLRDNGNYRMVVHARKKGSNETYEDYAFQDVFVEARDKASLAKLNIGTPKIGEEIKLHAIANSINTEFSFHVRINGEWSTIREYSDSSVCPYVPTEEGNYRFVVHAREVGSLEDYEDYKFIDVEI